MKVKLLTSGGFSGIDNAPDFKWDTVFEAQYTFTWCNTAVSISLKDLVAAGYSLSAASGGVPIVGYSVEGRERTFFLDEGEVIIVEAD